MNRLNRSLLLLTLGALLAACSADENDHGQAHEGDADHSHAESADGGNGDAGHPHADEESGEAHGHDH